MERNVKNVSFAILGFAFYLMKEDPGIGILKLRSVNLKIIYMWNFLDRVSINAFKLFLQIHDLKSVRIIAWYIVLSATLLINAWKPNGEVNKNVCVCACVY